MAGNPVDYSDADLIAVVGMAGRFPGARDADALWSLLIAGQDAIEPVPAQRWDAAAALDPEKHVQDVGGFIDAVDEFDAAFFGVSPREAEAIDPQQRLLLEIAWRALEDAGQRAADLAGTRTGVYVGASWHDYELMRIAHGARATQHSLVGNALDVIAARLSYFLKVRGPSMTVETGCSSSLVALHLAAQALRTGEVDAAVVGGTNLMLDPHVTVGLTHFGGLSPDGRCKTFSAHADGFVRGEGVAALYLKTLRRAVADGDRVHGVIARTAVNNDGGGESLVTPSQDGQEDLLRLAYAADPEPRYAPAYVEAHGTGTGRGDPIEVRAIGRVLGARRAGDPVMVGSVKTNIGHLEAAAGMAGLFKLLLSLRHGVVPPSLHSAELNPDIPFAELNVDVVREPLPLPRDEPVCLGLNSFGWGGTNAHAVLLSPPAQAAPDRDALPATGLPAVVAVSGHQEAALAARAADLVDLVPADDAGLPGFAGALAHRRDHFPVRAAVVAVDAPTVRSALTSVAAGAAVSDACLVSGRAAPKGRTAFVFPGQGSQWAGMGTRLYAESPVFAAVVDRCAEALRPHVDWDLAAVFTGAAGTEWTTRIDMLQPTLWAMSLGLAELWMAAGVRPDVVLGHSQGEVTAATLAGVLSYEDAALVMARRSAIARRTSGQGGMLAVDLSREDALAALDGFEDSVALAVHNGPTSCVLSGEIDSVLALKELLEATGTFCRLVNVDYASHSPQMDPLRDDLLAALAPVRPRAGEIDLMSTVDVAVVDGATLDAEYWTRNLRSPVLFADSVAAVLDSGVTHVVEISPHPILAPALEQLAAEYPEPPVVLSTLRRDKGCPEDMATALATAYVAGLEPFAALPARSDVALPGYPLRPERYWAAPRTRGAGAAAGLEAEVAAVPGDDETWQARLDLSPGDLPWLADHRVGGVPVLPAAGMLHLMVRAARTRTGSAGTTIADVAFRREIAFGDGHATVAVDWNDGGADGSRVRLLVAADGGWEPAATAVADRKAGGTAPAFPDWAGIGVAVDTADFYRARAERGLEYGPAFQAVRSLLVHPDRPEALAEVALPDVLRAANRSLVPHPVLWDGALQAALALLSASGPVVPTALESLRVLVEPDAPLTAGWSHAVRRADDRVDITVYGADRAPLLVMTGLELRELAGSGTADLDAARTLTLRWTSAPADPAPPAASGRWVVCGRLEGPAADLRAALAATGAEAEILVPASGLPGFDADESIAGVVVVVPGPQAGAEARARGLVWVTALVRGLSAMAAPPRLALVTSLAQAVTPADVPDPDAALFWGYGRVLRREHGELQSRLLDVDPAAEGWAQACAAELVDPARQDDDQVALRASQRLVARLSRGVDPDAGAALPPVLGAPQPFRALDGAWAPLVRRAPATDEVEVEVLAAAEADARLGVVGVAGRVRALGTDVYEFAVGDRVVALALGGVASHATVGLGRARAIPDWLDDTAAAALPLALAVAWHGLVDIGRVESQDTVLVRGAGAEFGAAAARIAAFLGARVIAAAATDEQARHAAALGADAVVDTRADWTARVAELTGGRGVDVVFDAVPGGDRPLGLGVLADGGRYVDVGAGPVRGGRALLTALSRGCGYFRVDVAGSLERRPRLWARLLDTVWDLVVSGKIAPLPTAAVPFADADACRAPEHAGRAVLVDPGTVSGVLADPLPGGRPRPDGTYVVSGGLGALGLSLVEFLAERGARAFILLGRTAPGPSAAARVEALRAAGVAVETARCDVTDLAAVGAALAALRPGMPPIRGVVHAAGVLRDATIATLTPDTLLGVLGPKAAGARVLDAVTADDPLDLFVLFSSAAGLVGNAGQAAYAAANTWLDAFAEARRRRGRPALSVQWGPFSGIGLAAADENRGDRLAERGMGAFPAEEAWPALLRMVERGAPVVGYVPLDVRRWFDAYPDTAALGSWRELRDAERGGGAVAGGEFRDRLRSAESDERRELVEAKVCELLARVLRLDPAGLDRRSAFKALGLDSLMGLELRNRMEAAFGMKLSPTLLWTYGSPHALSAALVDMVTA